MADFAYGFRQNTNYVITSNTLYEIGRNYRFSQLYPYQLQIPSPANNWSQINAGFYTDLALQSSGTLWAWGNNSYGQLGLNTCLLYTSDAADE